MFLLHRPFVLKVKEVVLKSAKVIPADVLIVGIGKCPADISVVLRNFSALTLQYLYITNQAFPAYIIGRLI